MKPEWKCVIGETLGAAIGTTAGLLALAYGTLALITNSLEVVF